jgi:ankyrin repeat protein
MTLFFQEFVAGEARYRGMSSHQTFLVREASMEDPPSLHLLRWEYACLRNLQHPVLPELVEAFEQDGYAYLVTLFPQGLRLDQKAAVKNLSESTLLNWAETLRDLLRYLDLHAIHLHLVSHKMIKSRDDRLKLIDLSETEHSPGHPNFRGEGSLQDDLKGLQKCLSDWFPEASASTRAALKGLIQRETRPEPEPALGNRIRLPQNSRRTCLAPGTRLSTYEVEFLTQGGMSLCYLGKHESGPRFIKEVKGDDVEGCQALRREYEVMRKLRHPHIVRAHQIFEEAGYLYLVMDFLEGSSLADSMSQGPASERDLLDWGQQLCETLDYLHAQKPPLIYRDLKPGNVVRSPAGSLFLIDFGLTRTYKVGQAKDTQALGTFSTASPEHFTGQTDARSDLFSLGATLYLLANPGFKPTAPFVFPPLRKAQPQYSADLERLLRRCLDPKPEARWPSAAALASELKALQKPFLKDEPATDPLAAVDDVPFLPNLSSHLALGTAQLAARVEAGDPLRFALEGLARECDIKSLSALWLSLADRVGQGQSFSCGLKAYPKVFSRAYVSLIEGNEKGRLLEGLRLVAQLAEKEDRARHTRTTPASEPAPPVAPRRRSLSRRVWTGLMLLLGGLALGATVEGLFKDRAAGAGASLCFWLLAISLWALRDARRWRVLRRTQNLVQDAWTSFALGETDKAEKELGEALVLSRDRLGPSHLNTLASLHSLANLCRERRQFKEAELYYTQALTIYDRILPEVHLARAHLHQHWAMNCEGQKDVVGALTQLQRSLAILNQLAEQNPLDLAEVQFFKGRLHFERAEDEQAMELLSQSLEIQYTQLGLKSPLVHRTMSYLTQVYVRQRLFKESEAHLAVLLTEGEQDLIPNYLALTEANLDMGLIRLEQDRKQDAEPYFLRALQMMQHYVGPNQRLLQRVLDGYCKVVGEQGSGVVQLISVFTGDREILRQALEKHPELVNARDNTGWGPLQWATFIGREDIVRWLLGRGADPGYDSGLAMGPLHVACAWDRAEALFALLERDPDVNLNGPGGWTPLFWCCQTGHTRLLENLLKKGADVNWLDETGRTALHIAAANNRLKAVAALLGAGAAINAQEPRAQATALHLAAERGHLGVCDCLIYNGADLRLRDAAGQTPLDLAEKNQYKLLARAMRRHLHEGLGKSRSESRQAWKTAPPA